MCPLSALCLMAGDGIGELYLQGVIILISLQFLDALYLQWLVGIVLHHGMIELFLLLTGE